MNVRLFVATAGLLAAVGLQAGEKHPFNVKGVYTETCSCKAPCPCELTGLAMGCEGVGAFQLSSGSYQGQDLTGLKAAYAGQPGSWVALYIQPASPEQTEAAKAFVSAVYGPWGKIVTVKETSIDISGEGGNYTVKVGAGTILNYRTKVVLGADGKTAIAHTNIASTLNRTFLQGLSEFCTYQDEGRAFTLKPGTNAYFNDQMDLKGDI